MYVYEGDDVIAGSGTKKSKLLWIGDQLAVVVKDDHTEMAWDIDSLNPVKTRKQLLKEKQLNSLLNEAAKHDLYPDKDFLEFLQEKGFLKDPE